MYTTVYPTSIVTRTSLPVYVDDVDDVEAKVVNDPITELVATQVELGLLPKGTHASVKARLVAVEMLSKARAYLNTSTQSIATGTYTKLQLNAENYDALSEFDSTTNYRFTAKGAGYYQVNGALQLLHEAAGKYLRCSIYKNGSIYSEGLIVSGGFEVWTAQISDIVPLAVDDYVELWVYHDGGANRSVDYGTEKTFMSVHKLSSS